MEISVITNTRKIEVIAENITEDVEVSLFLYNTENMSEPILYATLTSEKSSVDFTNLTSRYAYKVGAEIKNADKSVVLTITD